MRVSAIIFPFHSIRTLFPGSAVDHRTVVRCNLRSIARMVLTLHHRSLRPSRVSIKRGNKRGKGPHSVHYAVRGGESGTCGELCVALDCVSSRAPGAVRPAYTPNICSTHRYQPKSISHTHTQTHTIRRRRGKKRKEKATRRSNPSMCISVN